MATRATFVWRGDEFAKRVIPEAVASGLNAAAARVSGEIVRSFRKSPKPPPPGGPPRSYTGALARSIGIGAATPGRYKATVGTNLKYARVHELGGDIEPVRKKYLTIPLNKRAELIRRRFPDLSDLNGYFRRTRSGQLFLYIYSDVKSDPEKAIFRLVPRVRIPKRPFMAPGLRKATPAALRAMKTAMRNHIMGAVV